MMRLGDWVSYYSSDDSGHKQLKTDKQVGQLVEQHYEGEQLVNIVHNLRGFNQRVLPRDCQLERRGKL